MSSISSMWGRLVVSLFCLWFFFCGFSLSVSSRSKQVIPATRTVFQSATIIINEYLADPSTGAAGDANGDGTTNATQDEFVEIVNTGALPLDISGFTVSDAAQVRFTIPVGKVIPPGEAAVIFGGGAPVGNFGNAAANGLVFAIGGAGLNLANTADSIIIKDSLGVEIARHDYPPPASDIDQSLTRNPDITGSNFAPHLTISGGVARFSPGTRIDGRAFVNDDPQINSISPEVVVAGTGQVTLSVSGDKFQNGAQVAVDDMPINTSFISAMQLIADAPISITNSPGAHSVTVRNPDLSTSNSITFTVLGAVGINEFLADPPDDANGDGVISAAQDEFVEIINRTGSAIDVSGFTLSDAAQTRLTFPAGAIIPSGEAAVVFGGGSPTGEFGNAMANGLVFTASLSLNNTGDTITLRDSAGNTVEQIVYGSTEGGANQSINRNPEVTGIVFAEHSSIIESGGSLFSPGTQLDGLPFTIRPHIFEISPERMPLSDQPFQLSIRGSGFLPSSIVIIDSSTVSFQFVNSAELIATVPATVAQSTGTHSVQVRNAGGNRSNVIVLTIIPPPPELSFALPRQVIAGTGNFTLFVSGANFAPGSVVLIEETIIPTTFKSPHSLQAVVPASLITLPGTLRVRVRNIDGTISNERTIEVVLIAARIDSLSPAATVAGDSGFKIIVTGANFQSGATVIFDGTPLETAFVSSKELRAGVPASLVSTVGLRPVVVQNGDGQLSNDAVFTVAPDSPVILSFDPRSVVRGRGDTALSIIGEKFQPRARARLIESGQPGRFLNTTFIGGNRLEAELLAPMLEKAGKVFIRVENSDSGVSNTFALDVLIKDPMVINEFLADPPEGASGDANGDGTRSTSQDEFVEVVNRSDEPIDLSGFKLSDADATRHLFAEGTILPPREAVVIFGGGRPTGKFGNAAENGLALRASTGGLSLNNGGDTIRLEDKEGRTLQEVTFGSAEGNSNQSINRDPDVDGATFALHSMVALDSSRRLSPGTRTRGETFTIKPFVRSLTPAGIRIESPSFALTLKGENFLAGAIALFGSTGLETTHRSNSELEALIDGDMITEGGRFEVRVRNPKGEISSPSSFLIFDDPPHIASISPNKTGTGAASLEVAITGGRFQRNAKATVKGEAVEIRFISRERIVLIIPDKFFARAAEIEVQMTNEDGNRSNAVALKVENGPLITRLSRTKIKAGRGETEMTIGGVAFAQGAALMVGDKIVKTEFVSQNVLTARISAEMNEKTGTLVLQIVNPDGGRSNKASVRVVE